MGNQILYTLGYENITFKEFEKILEGARINLLIDVRDYPKSRKRGFSKTEMSEHFSNNGINYFHLKNLGSPAKLRKKVRKDRKYEYFFRKYKEYLAENENALIQLADIIRTGKACIFCYEQDFNLCHRKSIAGYLNALFDGEFEIIHL